MMMMKNALMMNIRKGGFTPRDTAGLYSTNYVTSETLTSPEGWTFVAMLQTNDNSTGNDSRLVWHHMIIYNIWFLSLFNRTLWSRPHVTHHLWYRMVKRVSRCFLNLSYFNYFLSRRSHSELIVLTEDRHLTTLPSTSSLLPSPGDLGAEPATSGPSLSEQDSVSIPEGTHPAAQLISAKVLPLWRKILPSRQTLTAQFALSFKTSLVYYFISILSDVFDGHLLGSNDSQVKEKSTMKAILANFLPGNSYNPIPFPLWVTPSPWISKVAVNDENVTYPPLRNDKDATAPKIINDSSELTGLFVLCSALTVTQTNTTWWMSMSECQLQCVKENQAPSLHLLWGHHLTFIFTE